MQEEKEQTKENETSVSVELTEADYFDAAKREAAIAELMEKAQWEEMQTSSAPASPSAVTQERVLVRPKIHVGRAVLNALVPLCVAAGIFCALFFTLPRHRLGISLGVSLGALGLYFLIRLRAFLIWCITVYQAVAPDRVRLRCVFTPSCSEYAIEALTKYGVLRGVPRIWKRLWRCHPPNGGDDPLQ